MFAARTDLGACSLWHLVTLWSQIACCRASADEATSILELYVRAVMSSDEFDKDVFDTEHFAVPSWSALQSAFKPIAVLPLAVVYH